MKDIEKIQKIIDESNNIIFFGGAGVSTESGLKDFRSKDGLYSMEYKITPEEMLSSFMFYSNTEEFYKFYRKYLNAENVEPNVCHLFLVALEEKGKLKAVITQNIDGLHQKAGSKNVLEIHGTTYKNHCIKCNKEYNADYVFKNKNVPYCECGGLIKPNVVLYGEMLPPCFDTAMKYIHEADTLIVAGSSLTVEPAAGLVKLFKGKNLIIINRDETPYDEYANIVIHDSIGKIFSKLEVK